jgi:regulator of protease activity HflC (stomatin/prohibitin superfamily)
MSLLIGLLAGAGLVLIAMLIRAGVNVDNGTVGVLTTFGRFARDTHGKVRTLDPGFHWRAPWSQLHAVSLAERSVGPGHEAAIEALASDGTRIRLNARLRYRVDPKHVATFLAEAKDATHHVSWLFRQTLREQIARFEQRPEELSAYTALRMRMNELQERVQAALKEPALEEYGVQVIAVDLLQIDPPEELVDALNGVITAESEANQLVSRTELQCQQRMLSAEHAVTIAHARARAQESEILTVGLELKALADQGVLRDYVARRRLEVLGGSRRVYLNHQPTRS